MKCAPSRTGSLTFAAFDLINTKDTKDPTGLDGRNQTSGDISADEPPDDQRKPAKRANFVVRRKKPFFSKRVPYLCVLCVDAARALARRGRFFLRHCQKRIRRVRAVRRRALRAARLPPDET